MKDSGECRVHTTEGTSQQNLAAGQAVLNARHSPELVKGGQGRCSERCERDAKIWFICVVLCIAFIFAALVTGCEGSKRQHSEADEPKAEIVSEKEAERVLKNLLNGL